MTIEWIENGLVGPALTINWKLEFSTFANFEEQIEKPDPKWICGVRKFVPRSDGASQTSTYDVSL